MYTLQPNPTPSRTYACEMPACLPVPSYPPEAGTEPSETSSALALGHYGRLNRILMLFIGPFCMRLNLGSCAETLLPTWPNDLRALYPTATSIVLTTPC
jgi:hypothetical protein